MVFCEHGNRKLAYTRDKKKWIVGISEESHAVWN